jgi:galactofuranosylgalactofuranosylrhamnosyl-N-acetylglucosaminyl-diphospho-decaprenol beta-1,5/1,6-galactofuranosyltransferase
VTELRVLQRIVFPLDDLDVVPLYVETNLERGAAELASEALTESLSRDKVLTATTSTPVVSAAVAGESQSVIRFGADLTGARPEEAGPRRTAEIMPGRRVSFSTYFNAFPASYWRRWTDIAAVTLRIRLAGESTVVIYASSAKGRSYPVETITIGSDEPETIERTLSLKQFIDGGWYWFDVVAGPRGTTLITADWAARTDNMATGRVSIGITTFNRPDFVASQLRNLGAAADVQELLDAVYVVDQGSSQVTEHPDFADSAKGLGDKLQVIVQGNLGGSGGFSRGMDETLRAGQSDYVLLLDDDITLDPEGILRAVTFADLARRPTIVGGHMFSLYDRSVLHAFGETVAPYKWWWGAAPRTKQGHDFARRNLRHTPWLHRRVDADYNGWWMCLIPVKIIEEIGLALPVFIKWDDAEYGLRARRAGYPTVSMPGMAAWHVPWHDKTDAYDWQAYYHARNRIVAALLHSPYDHGGALVTESAEVQVQHLLCMQYSTAALRLLAIEDVLSGPDHLHRELMSRMKELRGIRLRYTDAQTKGDVEHFPPVRRRKPLSKGREFTSPSSQFGLVRKAAAGAVRQLMAPKADARSRPQVALAHQDANWWVLSNMDSALVSAADGSGTAWYQRDPQLFRSLTQRSAVLHARLLKDWPRLAAEYRSQETRFTSPARWRETFQASVDNPLGRR